MSIHIMSLVWKRSKQKGGDLLLLLALADFANDDGYCWPSVETLGKRSRLTERHVRRILRRLIKDGEIGIQAGAGRHGSNRYRVTPPAEEIELFDQCALCAYIPEFPGGIDRHHILPRSKGGGELNANKIPVCKSCHLTLHDCRTHDLSERGKILLRDGIEAAKAHVPVQPDKKSGGQGGSLFPDAGVSQTVNEPSSNTNKHNGPIFEFERAWSVCPHVADPSFVKAWAEWEAFRKSKRKPISPQAGVKQLKKLGAVPLENAIAAIDKAIESDWQSVHPRASSGPGPGRGSRQASFA